jgi:hypothetical protein
MRRNREHNMESENKEILKYLKRIAKANRADQIVIRGLLSGIFTALGATVGLAIIGVIFLNWVGGLKQIPFIDDILRQTKLDVIIENQLNQLTQTTSTTSTTSSATISEAKYESTKYGFSFDYPTSLSSVSELTGTSAASLEVQLTGSEGSLPSLEVHVDEDVAIYGNNSQVFVPKDGMERVVVDVYEEGATVAGSYYSNNVFVAEIEQNSHTYLFIGVSSSDEPKAAREIFINIIESVQFS